MNHEKMEVDLSSKGLIKIKDIRTGITIMTGIKSDSTVDNQIKNLKENLLLIIDANER